MAWVLLGAVVIAASGIIAALVYRARTRDATRGAAEAAQKEAAALAQVRELAAAHDEARKRWDAEELELRARLDDLNRKLLERAKEGEPRADLTDLFGGKPS